MTNNKHFFTSESVTEGHPDKIADQISDAVLDAVLKDDPKGHVACETFVTTGMALVGGEIRTNTYVDITKVVRDTIKEIGYENARSGFDWKTCAVINVIQEQSPDIAQGVDESQEREQGAGDQGIMFGYATNETKELMPLPIVLAHRITKNLTDARKKGILSYLRPDGKSQITVEYEGNVAKRVDAIVVAAQHTEDITHDQIKKDIIEKVIKTAIPNELLDENTNYYVNETGRFVIGGPHGDTGLTGRKIIVDTYGGKGSHGGGCFSGKDPSKVDRSGAYMARYVAKNIVAAGLADQCEVQISYAIGVPHPVSLLIDTFKTSKIPEDQIATLVTKHFDLRPKAIIEHLKLLRPIYKKTAAYGHFGREDPDFTWEYTDKAEILRNESGL
ncbi:methionine adenosyltransferase [archaeon]|nr:methionine adenosyltransferase [archaeon]